MVEIKQLLNNEKDEALLFAKKVYIESRDESYSEKGIETFCNFVDSKKITKSFKVYGAFEDSILKGVIATDRRKRHINLFFVDKSSQAKGIGKKLMNI
ncbi:MAG: GNAT family N-acetyltransferase, partial [Fusobacterium periodonticum]|nr:GNAT family N-acetyltransferase [Fusobacterium periodonticum]